MRAFPGKSARSLMRSPSNVKNRRKWSRSCSRRLTSLSGKRFVCFGWPQRGEHVADSLALAAHPIEHHRGRTLHVVVLSCGENGTQMFLHPRVRLERFQLRSLRLIADPHIDDLRPTELPGKMIVYTNHEGQRENANRPERSIHRRHIG